LYFVGKRTRVIIITWTSLVSFLSSPAPPPRSCLGTAATIPPINYVWNPARWRRSGHTRSGNDDHFLCGDLSHGRSRPSISAARPEPRARSVRVPTHDVCVRVYYIADTLLYIYNIIIMVVCLRGTRRHRTSIKTFPTYTRIRSTHTAGIIILLYISTMCKPHKARLSISDGVSFSDHCRVIIIRVLYIHIHMHT